MKNKVLSRKEVAIWLVSILRTMVIKAFSSRAAIANVIVNITSDSFASVSYFYAVLYVRYFLCCFISKILNRQREREREREREKERERERERERETETETDRQTDRENALQIESGLGQIGIESKNKRIGGLDYTLCCKAVTDPNF